MSTSSIIRFASRLDERPEKSPTVYIHHDGMPNRMIPFLTAFFHAVKYYAPSDDKFGDPEYLAMRFMAFFAFSRKPGNFLAASGAGVLATDGGVHTGQEYEYTVLCDDVNGTLYPEVRVAGYLGEIDEEIDRETMRVEGVTRSPTPEYYILDEAAQDVRLIDAYSAHVRNYRA